VTSFPQQEPAPTGPPVCPRHPDQVAYVSCQRCGRPTCPECQRPAAVGIQCVDCVAEARRSAPRPTSRFGAPARPDTRPVVTLTIIGVCVVVYLGQRLNPQVTSELMFVPVLTVQEPWRMLTAAFVHSPTSLFHILFNMYALYIIGGYLEPMLGRLRFGVLYFVSALGGSVGYVLLATGQGWLTPTVGASGAVFGLFAAVLVLNWHLGRDTAGILVLLAINGVIGFVIPNIAWQAHLGGAVTGAAVAGVLALTAAKGRDPAAVRRRSLQWPLFVGIVLLLVAAASWRVEQVQGLFTMVGR
jgi:membrane associated rhomboid family serine protease